MTFDHIRSRAEEDWRRFAASGKPRVLIGAGTCGRAAGTDEVRSAISEWLSSGGVDADVRDVGCLGLCYAEPLVELSKPGAPRILYGSVSPENVPALLEDYLRKDKLDSDGALAVMDGPAQGDVPAFSDLDMLKGQVRIVLRNCGLIDPENIFHYIAKGGYAGLAKALAMPPDKVTEEVKDSGLRGRGGVGFPAGLKWEFVSRESSDVKYVVVNAEEGEAGTFKDCALLEGDPHSVIEGMLIAGWALGASRGAIFVQAEYARSASLLRTAVRQAESLGLAGENILGTSFSFEIDIHTGVGAYVCGEETALLECLEGARGTPRTRPPFPAQKGLWGKPTLVNNAETFANVPFILRKGAASYRQVGTADNAGSKIFSLSGELRRPGVVEFPLGVTLERVVFEACGGLPEGKVFKAAMVGGPTGGYVPEKHLDLALDFTALEEIGAMMGSGGIVVIGDDTCIVESTYHSTVFLRDESCGKCAPCRLGTRQMAGILSRITSGQGRMEDLAILEEIAECLNLSATCGLGQAAGNPLVSSLRHFRDEYEQHILHRACPAGVCRLQQSVKA